MMHALERFGIPKPMLDMIGAIYQHRFFTVLDPEGDSTKREQRAGIAQGCPLSPYLFIIVQTVLMHDVSERLVREMQQQQLRSDEPAFLVLSELLYADDTLLVSSSPRRLQLHMDLVIDEGQRYGLEVNFSKTVAMNVNCETQLMQPTGQPVKIVEQAVYLGGMLCANAAASPEVSRRIGEAKGAFEALQKCWSHANITRKRKIEIYKACVVSKLMYGLETLWLLQNHLQRIDAFHVKCLRRILHIPCSYLSRVPNSAVLEVAGEPLLSAVLQKRQVAVYKSIAQMPADHLIRRLVCKPSSDEPRVWTAERRRGRPKQQWAACVWSVIAAAAE